jgi:uncharacterized protein YegP (UPF0339 family)
MKFVVDNTESGKATWWLYSGDALAAWAGEEFDSKWNARRAAAAFKAGAYSALYDVYLDDAGKYRWRAWRSSDKVAASGKAFTSKSAAEAAAETVRLNAGSATLD